jgi:hypothetical protein
MSMQRLLIRIGIVIVLAIVFLAYLQPEFVFDVASRIALCF